MNDLRVLQRIAGYGAATVSDVVRLCEMKYADALGYLRRLERKGYVQVDNKQWTATDAGMSAALNPAAREGL